MTAVVGLAVIHEVRPEAQLVYCLQGGRLLLLVTAVDPGARDRRVRRGEDLRYPEHPLGERVHEPGVHDQRLVMGIVGELVMGPWVVLVVMRLLVPHCCPAGGVDDEAGRVCWG
jgi:hypothetical protein